MSAGAEKAARARVTVCVPTIGRMDYLPKTKAAIDAQTMTDIEIVILDNASGPEARAFIDEWSKSASNVRIIRSDPRLPMLDNFNLGVRATKTELLTFIHDDDEILPQFLEKLVGLLERYPSAGLAGSNYDFIDERSEVTEKRRWASRDTLLTRREYVKALIARGRNLIPMPGLVYRTEILGDGFDASLPINFGDFIMLMSYAEKMDIAVLAEPVVRIRRHTAQASQVPLSRGLPIRTKLLRDYLDGYAERYPEDRALVEYLRRRITLTQRVGLLWGWASALDDAERAACLDSLDKTRVDAALSAALRAASAVGLRPNTVARNGLTVARRVAETLGL
jgi:glycosyltransferase involved in cell wall biosynthesis